MGEKPDLSALFSMLSNSGINDKKPEEIKTQEKPKTTRKRTTKKPETKTEDTEK